MRVTIREVASTAGVHYGTVSRALNPDTAHLVAKKTRERVQKVADELGYTPNTIARGLKKNRTQTVGVVVPDIASPVIGHLVRGVEDRLSPHGYIALVANTDDDREREQTQIRALMGRSVDGLIVASAHLSGPTLEELAEHRIPVVHANRHGHGESIASVTSDDAPGVYSVVDHLVRLGHRRIAYLGGPLDTSTGQTRSQAFRFAMAEKNLAVDEKLVVHAKTFRTKEGEQLAAALLAAGEEFTAIVAGNDMLAIGCLDTLRTHHIACPDDISVVGFNDMPFVDKLSPPLTSVKVPHYDIGTEAAALMLQLMHAEASSPRTVLLPVALVVRESTGAAQVP
ncbi:LacI family DNA-binding transcriptional regulator [Nesterenkonia ebinurensis]|uniref:LacI family DNA-binding transcriptional regulator n=1 Tax=Nesterenkonia ebinurensis TaxID=2608252 RepID=UPI00123D5FB6|nr:LacI family DNA-binding transcriptional regulator [Nesterenkonia ebinurensis]